MRVHQLAKELNLKAKELFPHLKKLGIEFKNHMSALTTDDIERVRKLLHPPTAEEIVEKRLQPTLIRRRRKIVLVEPPEEPKESAEKETAEEIPAIVKPTEKEKEEAETLPVKEAEQQKKVVDTTSPKKPPAVKIISKKVELPEAEKETGEVKRKGK
ncbi:MAG: translation initiation factor IF-2 N-terminal domain-containing protein, partial [Deltaproteobacteria bacterium]|nr:translation initiation factor IF-2 N-terminal domain-containing protein [Deltaproteobacteria bacterium]